MKILILKPSSLGDVVQALPVLRLIKRHLPDSEIYWWLDEDLLSLLEGDPDLTGVIPFARRRWTAPGHWGEMWDSIQRTRAQDFDWVIDLQGLARSGAFAWLANGRITVGLDEAREGARGFYDVVARRSSFYTHAVDWYLAVLPLLGVPVHWDFEWLPTRPAVANAVNEKWQTDSTRWLVLQPGARWLNKRWPVGYFAELVRQLAGHNPELHFAILGSREDRELGRAIAGAAPERCVDLIGQTTLPEMVEWVRRCEMMVTNDTGPMHVAAALGKPVVALFGPTEPRRTGPYGQLERVRQLPLPCSPCMNDSCAYEKPFECLRGISPESVLSEVQWRLRARVSAALA